LWAGGGGPSGTAHTSQLFGLVARVTTYSHSTAKDCRVHAYDEERYTSLVQPEPLAFRQQRMHCLLWCTWQDATTKLVASQGIAPHSLLIGSSGGVTQTSVASSQHRA